MMHDVFVPLFALYSLFASSQIFSFSISNEKTSKLIVEHYVNNREKHSAIRANNVLIYSNNKRLVLKDSSGLFVFPQVAREDTLEVTVKIGRKSITMTQIPGWRLSSGATISVGKLSNFRRVTSIAKEDDMQENETDYVFWNNRYRIAPQGSTIDLEGNPNKIKKVYYMIVAGNSSRTTVMVHQIKYK